MTRLLPIVMMTLLTGGLPAAGLAQSLEPLQVKPRRAYDESLSRPVPVATVVRAGDLFTPAGGRLVDDGRGEPFVLGHATLDLKDPSHAKVLFTITNVTERPVRFIDVMISETMLCSIPGKADLFAFPGVGTRPADGYYDPRTFQPGDAVTLQIPIPPSCKRNEPIAILVSVGKAPAPDLPSGTQIQPDRALFFRVLDQLRAEPTQGQAVRR